jgi:hypothetical protein
MELKRKVAMVAATLSVALGAGHIMQNGFGVKPGRVALVEEPATAPAIAPTDAPKEIIPLAAGLGNVPALEPSVQATPALPDAAFSPAAEEEIAPPIEQVNLPDLTEPGTDSASKPETVISGDSTNCPVRLGVMANAQATLDLTLVAPCRASERVVIRHGGLAVTGMTTLTGSLFTSIPGMDSAGEVSVLFGDGVEVNAAEALTDLALYRRFAVQWVADDAFQINAFENGAVFGGEGHVSSANPHRRLANVPMESGYLDVLGDASAPLPMLAEVYTFPIDPADPVDLTIEASVTAATCDRELLGEVLLSEGGTTTKTDLTMATPTCDAIGDVLVLNNPLPDLKLAAAN